MPVSQDTLRAFREAEYRVRLPQGGCAVIRISQPLPGELHGCVKNDRTPWAFITAWNPLARRASRVLNRARQRELLAALRELGAAPRVGIGNGTGKQKWREPSLFVTGLDFAALDALARRFEQAAIVRGVGGGKAELHPLL